LIVNCSSDSAYVPKKIDDDIEKIGKTEEGSYGYNEDGEVVIQEEKDPAYELMIVKKANQTLFLELERDAFALDQCIQEFSDPSLKGDGKFKNVDDYESLRPDYDATKELGVTEDGKLKIVKRTYLKKRLDEAESQKEKISKALRYVQKELRKCESELKFRKKALNQ
jgi:hypothetical protein